MRSGWFRVLIQTVFTVSLFATCLISVNSHSYSHQPADDDDLVLDFNYLNNNDHHRRVRPLTERDHSNDDGGNDERRLHNRRPSSPSSYASILKSFIQAKSRANHNSKRSGVSFGIGDMDFLISERLRANRYPKLPLTSQMRLKSFKNLLDAGR
ncbi:uncharacterized protein LOC141913111 isoform X2 [Tubulanus polymorphus]|uniref:uncharacterized protein LOC141913111 isoform X2 n=1 Tax=Tubulanus polymorphus TaxID=672921 RepID=UPI003DA403EB